MPNSHYKWDFSKKKLPEEEAKVHEERNTQEGLHASQVGAHRHTNAHLFRFSLGSV